MCYLIDKAANQAAIRSPSQPLTIESGGSADYPFQMGGGPAVRSGMVSYGSFHAVSCIIRELTRVDLHERR
jgi:hypothetical protein